METDPAPIPRRVVLRLAAGVLRCQADQIRRRTAGYAGRRRGPGAAYQAAQLRPGRLAAADQAEADAGRLETLAGDAAFCCGPGVDAAIVGYLLAVLGGHGESMSELVAEMESAGMAPPQDRHAVPLVRAAIGE